jgi:hypothetical protein
LLDGLSRVLTAGVLADSTTTDIAILSVISMAGGYLLLAGLWYFVFRDKSGDEHKRKR